MLSDNLRLNFFYLKMIHILHPHYHPKIIEHILKNKQKNKCVFIHEIIRLTVMKMKMKMKIHHIDTTYDLDLEMDTNKQYNRSLCMMLISIKQHLSNV